MLSLWRFFDKLRDWRFEEINKKSVKDCAKLCVLDYMEKKC